jgi:hypothetical protein
MFRDGNGRVIVLDDFCLFGSIIHSLAAIAA